MDMTPIDASGPSVEEAIQTGLNQLGLSRTDVIVEIVDEGSPGILGMGSRRAEVRLTPLRPPRRQPTPPPEPEPPAAQPEQVDMPEPGEPAEAYQEVIEEEDLDELPEPEEEPVEEGVPMPSPAPATFASEPTGVIDEEAMIAREVIGGIVDRMGYRANVHIDAENIDDPESPWVLDVRGADLGSLIGKKGETLEALQYLARLIVSRQLQRRVDIIIDVEGYKARREASLRKLAERMARQATRMGRTVTLEPMPPNERRIIHMALRNHNEVSTESVGSGNKRRVTIIPNV
ncbi:MAG: KH domain-containing protein [Chloroflexi bacterium]|nr:KH domain-containing protein [Chloroflexota bacterium]